MAFFDDPYGMPRLGPEYYSMLPPSVQEEGMSPFPSSPEEGFPMDVIVPPEMNPQNPFAMGTDLGEPTWYSKILSTLARLSRGSEAGIGFGELSRGVEEGDQRRLAGNIRRGFEENKDVSNEGLSSREYNSRQLGRSLRRRADVEEFLAYLQASRMGDRVNKRTGLTTNQALSQYQGALNNGRPEVAEQIRRAHPEISQMLEMYQGEVGLPPDVARKKNLGLRQEQFGYQQDQDFLDDLDTSYDDYIKDNNRKIKEITKLLNEYDGTEKGEELDRRQRLEKELASIELDSENLRRQKQGARYKEPLGISRDPLPSEIYQFGKEKNRGANLPGAGIPSAPPEASLLPTPFLGNTYPFPTLTPTPPPPRKAKKK